ncbi:MAG: ATP-binding protein [Gammaproteobacteria bacterium AqS3]|nr:ATP-binding protein [Gammaproteobacteria bacterium AqS3]
MAGNEKGYKLNFFALEILSHLGKQLYRNFSTVVSEAVSNSWDAGATEVRIYIDPQKKYMTITDNGVGMDSEDFQDRFLTIGYSKRSDGDTSMLNRRRPHGRKGIGKLALLSVSEKLTIVTRKKGGEEVRGTIDNNKLDQLADEKETEYRLEFNRNSLVSIENHGTILEFENIKPRFNSSEKIRSYMALAFSFAHCSKDPEDRFDIYVNNQLVERKRDLKDLDSNTEMLWTFNQNFDMSSTFSDDLKDNFLEHFNLQNELRAFEFENQEGQSFTAEIGGYIGSVKKPRQLRVHGTGTAADDEQFKAGVHLYTNGRLRQFNIFEIVESSSVVPSYLYGEIHVDAFDAGNHTDNDMFTSSREGILEDDPRFQSFKAKLKQILLQIVNDWSQHRRRDRTKSVGNSLSAMKPRFRNVIDDYLKTDDPEDRDSKANKVILELRNVSGENKREDLARKKSVLICHSSKDKLRADFVFQLLFHFGVTADEVIYSSASDTDDERAARLPVEGFMEYLKSFFNQHIYEAPTIVLIHSSHLKTWHPTIEVGASWIAGAGQRIIQVVSRDERGQTIESETIDSPLTQGDLYLELEEGEQKKFAFTNNDTASQWFRDLVNFCRKRKGQKDTLWSNQEFQAACDAVNEKMREKGNSY